MTEQELDIVMEVVSKELHRAAGGTNGTSRDQFRAEINDPWNKIRDGVIDRLSIKVAT